MELDLTHYIRRPYMVLPLTAATAAGIDGDQPTTWSGLTDQERDRMWATYTPTVTVAMFNPDRTNFVAVAATEPAARTAIERAWAAHIEEHKDCCGGDENYPVADETYVVTGPLKSVWRDGSLYPKGDN